MRAAQRRLAHVMPCRPGGARAHAAHAAGLPVRAPFAVGASGAVGSESPDRLYAHATRSGGCDLAPVALAPCVFVSEGDAAGGPVTACQLGVCQRLICLEVFAGRWVQRGRRAARRPASAAQPPARRPRASARAACSGRPRRARGGPTGLRGAPAWAAGWAGCGCRWRDWVWPACTARGRATLWGGLGWPARCASALRAPGCGGRATPSGAVLSPHRL
jgi:hypothetical protein